MYNTGLPISQPSTTLSVGFTGSWSRVSCRWRHPLLPYLLLHTDVVLAYARNHAAERHGRGKPRRRTILAVLLDHSFGSRSRPRGKRMSKAVGRTRNDHLQDDWPEWRETRRTFVGKARFGFGFSRMMPAYSSSSVTRNRCLTIRRTPLREVQPDCTFELVCSIKGVANSSSALAAYARHSRPSGDWLRQRGHRPYGLS